MKWFFMEFGFSFLLYVYQFLIYSFVIYNSCKNSVKFIFALIDCAIIIRI